MTTRLTFIASALLFLASCEQKNDLSNDAKQLANLQCRINENSDKYEVVMAERNAMFKAQMDSSSLIMEREGDMNAMQQQMNAERETMEAKLAPILNELEKLRAESDSLTKLYETKYDSKEKKKELEKLFDEEVKNCGTKK